MLSPYLVDHAKYEVQTNSMSYFVFNGKLIVIQMNPNNIMPMISSHSMST